MSEKTPTNHAILKAFQKYEEAFNVAIRALPLVPNDIVREYLDNRLYKGHSAFKHIALEALERKEAKKA